MITVKVIPPRSSRTKTDSLAQGKTRGKKGERKKEGSCESHKPNTKVKLNR